MILLTGSDGFIGKRFLNNLQKNNDVLKLEKNGCFDFLSNFNYWQDIKLILHQGAMTNTRETNKQLFNKYNFEFSIELFKKAIQYKIPIKYASSASVYGNNEKGFDPLNEYAISKLEIDNWVNDNLDKFELIQGFRYFNVYGQGEENKIITGQASPVSTFLYQAKNEEQITLFEGSHNFYRDFIFVDDVINLVLHNDKSSGIFDLGTSSPRSFQSIGEIISEKMGVSINYISFPEDLLERYQFNTCSKQIWDNYKFCTVEKYLNQIE